MSHSSHSHHSSHRKEYFFIFGLLTVLTILELFIPGLKATTMAKGAALVVLALGKAFLVAFYYMHLKEETKWLRFIAVIPISAALYATMVIMESLYR